MREQPVSEQELNDAKDYLDRQFSPALRHQPQSRRFLAQVEYYELGLDYPDRYADSSAK